MLASRRQAVAPSNCDRPPRAAVDAMQNGRLQAGEPARLERVPKSNVCENACSSCLTEWLDDLSFMDAFHPCDGPAPGSC